MRWRRVAFGVVLAGSVAGNAYLLLAQPEALTSTQAPKNPHVAVAVHPRPSRAAKPEPAPTEVVVPPEVAALDRAALEKRLVDAEAKLDKVLQIYEKFKRHEH